MKRLKILVVGHCHPEMPHVCGLRTKGFAEALTRRGHQVVLLTGTLPQAPSVPSADQIIDRLSRFSTSGPLVLGCLPRGHGWSRRARQGSFPFILNKAVLTGSFVAQGGLFTDWVSGTRPYWPALADHWRPDVVWATFGNTGAWLIAQGIARRAGCPWVMDMKDPWSDFIPGPMRRLLAARFRDAAAATALADTHGDDLRRWFRGEPVTVPSGVDIPSVGTTTPSPDKDAFRISLVGSLYDDNGLRILLAGIASWARKRGIGSTPPAVLEYYGNETERFLGATTDLRDVCEVRTRGFIPPAELARCLHTSHVNAFVNARSGFRHKVLEFAVAGRPILCVPAAGADEHAVVRQTGCVLHGCTTAAEVKSALDNIENDKCRDKMAPIDIEAFSWDARAGQLEQVFERVLG